jgi:hypothetical protein
MHDTRPFKAPRRVDASRSLFPVFTCISHYARTHARPRPRPHGTGPALIPIRNTAPATAATNAEHTCLPAYVPSPAGPEVRFDICAAPPARLPPTPRDSPLRPALTSPGRPSTTKHTTTHFLDLSVRLGRAACMHTCLHACAAPRAGRKRRITPARVRNGGGRKARDDEMGTRAFAHAEQTNRRQRREATMRLLVYSTPCALMYVLYVVWETESFFSSLPFLSCCPALPARSGSETGCCCCCGGGGFLRPTYIRRMANEHMHKHKHRTDTAPDLLDSATRT